jgi:hypothetical protein
MTHHAFVLVIDRVAVIDEAPDNHRIGEGDDHFQRRTWSVAGGTARSRKLSSFCGLPPVSVTRNGV